MMNPLAYLREIERHETEMASRSLTRSSRQMPKTGAACFYSREKLPCGCVVYQMRSSSPLRPSGKKADCKSTDGDFIG
jgi:hypothetical protein